MLSEFVCQQAWNAHRSQLAFVAYAVTYQDFFDARFTSTTRHMGVRIDETRNKRSSLDVHIIDSQPTVQIRHVCSHIHNAVSCHEDVAYALVFRGKHMRVSNKGQHDGSSRWIVISWQDR